MTVCGIIIVSLAVGGLVMRLTALSCLLLCSLFTQICVILLIGLYKAVLAHADKVGAVSLDKSFYAPAAVFGLEILELCSLHSLFLSSLGYIHLFHGVWVKLGVEHTGGYGSRGRIGVLHLLGAHFQAF